MIVVTTDFIPRREIIEALGVVQGSTVQSKHLGRDIGAELKSIIGGELTGYSEMLTEARKIAHERMVDQGKALGADAIINVRYASSAVTAGAAEILAYGTAVSLK